MTIQDMADLITIHDGVRFDDKAIYLTLYI